MFVSDHAYIITPKFALGQSEACSVNLILNIGEIKWQGRICGQIYCAFNIPTFSYYDFVYTGRKIKDEIKVREDKSLLVNQ